MARRIAPSLVAVGYIDAALFTSTDESTPSGGVPLDQNYSSRDIDSATLDQMIADADGFALGNQELLAASGLPSTRIGQDFWLSRNGHGSGFFDEDIEPRLADALQESARREGSYDLYVGDDGRIHGFPPPGSRGRRG